MLVYPKAYENWREVNDFTVGHLQRVMNERGAAVEPKPKNKKFI